MGTHTHTSRWVFEQENCKNPCSDEPFKKDNNIKGMCPNTHLSPAASVRYGMQQARSAPGLPADLSTDSFAARGADMYIWRSTWLPSSKPRACHSSVLTRSAMSDMNDFDNKICQKIRRPTKSQFGGLDFVSAIIVSAVITHGAGCNILSHNNCIQLYLLFFFVFVFLLVIFLCLYWFIAMLSFHYGDG